MLASAGVSDVQLKVVVTVAPDRSTSVANSWSSNPTGSGGSLMGRRPLKVMSNCGGPSLLQRPNVRRAGPNHLPVTAFSCSDEIDDELDGSSTLMSVDVIPAAGPPTAAKEPSYERNWTTAPSCTSAKPSGLPF